MPGPRSLALLIPAFAPRREGDLGIGDIAALRDLCPWAERFGVGVLQLLPVNEMGPDCSPYNAISSVALDPVYLEMSPQAVPGLEAGDVAAARAALPGDVLEGPLIDYPAVRRAKHGLLTTAYERLHSRRSGPEWKAFLAFRKDQAAWLDDYCAFRYLMDLEGGRETWDTWPDHYNTADKARAYLAGRRAAAPRVTNRALGFHAFVQWVAFTQWENLRRHAEKHHVRLMGDIPIGVSYYSCDVFFQPDQFHLDWSGGAPPETVFKDDPFVQKWGQNWGIPLYRWDRMEAEGFPWWRQRIHKLTDIFHIFRIDHVLGFYRIYRFPWRPQRNAEFLDLTHDQAAARTGGRLPGFWPHEDDTDEHKGANREAGDRYIRVVQEAAGEAEVIAEDLGVVPDYVRPHLAERGIPGFKIVHWEHDQHGHVTPGSAYPEASFAAITTHDHESIRGLWQRLRAEARSERGDHDDHWKAKRDLRFLCDFAGIHAPHDEWPEWDHRIQWALISSLMRSNSRYAAIMVTDLYARTERFNIPGVLAPANWRQRLPWTVEEMGTNPELVAAGDALRSLAVETGRLVVG